MKSYSIKVDTEEKKFISSADEKTTELGILLQIWQDLTMMDRLAEKSAAEKPAQEDSVIRALLQKILIEEFGRIEAIPMPEYYKKQIKEHNL